MEILKVVELFSGIGAWSKALENLNITHEVVLAVDQDKYPVTAYNAIHNSDFEPIDITKLNEKDVPNCDIICYSPPCQSFSAAGKQLGFEDTRGILFFDALRIIEEKKPKYALMENVKGLTQKKFSNEFKIMLEELEKAGYKNYWKVLNAKDFNVAQNRERVFVISIRVGIEREFEFPREVELQKRIEDYLEEKVNDGFFLSEERTEKLLSTKKKKHLPSKNGIIQINNPTYSQQRVYSPLGISPTIAAGNLGGGKEPCKILLDDVRIRSLTPNEVWRIMGFEDRDFRNTKEKLNEKFYKGKNKSKTQLYKMAGNSIPINVCEALFKQLFNK